MPDTPLPAQEKKGPPKKQVNPQHPRLGKTPEATREATRYGLVKVVRHLVHS